jgi:gamma-glutamylcysteine synthetase
MQLNLKPRAPTDSLTSKISENTPIESRSQLVAYLEAGCRPREEFRIGVEQEVFVCWGTDCRPAAYDGAEEGKTFAKGLMQGFQNEWQRNIDTAVQTLAEETMA